MPQRDDGSKSTSSGVGPEAVGRAIRSLRTRQKITMVELGKRSGISQSYLSEIESGKRSPSLSTLFAVAEQLGMTPAGLLHPPVHEDEVAVVRADAGEVFPISETPGGGYFRAILTIGPLSATEFVASPGDDLTGDFEHNGYEFIYLAQGSLAVTLRDRTPVLLGPGDAMSYPGDRPHSWELVGEETVRVVQILDVPDFPQLHPFGTHG